MSEKSLGVHILAELGGCNPDKLNSIEFIKNMMVCAALKAKANVKEIAFHKFSPQGVSGVVVIAESHLSIHTWPEIGYAAIDVYTCSETTYPELAVKYIGEELEAKGSEITRILRGTEKFINEFLPSPVHI